MATTPTFIEYFYQQIQHLGQIRYQKMFGEYMVYVSNKPIFIVCDDTVFVKMKDEIKHLFPSALCLPPYKGAKPHYVVDIDDIDLVSKVIEIMVVITPIPKRTKR